MSDVVRPTENQLIAPVKQSELVMRVLEMRRLGTSYRGIAIAIGKSEATVNRWAREAVQSGLVPADMIPPPVQRGLPDDEYNRRWIEGVRANCVVDANGCWLWQGHLALNGYGQRGYRGKTRVLHRKMYELHHGLTLGRWEYACHSCDVKRCCNPEHLWRGTPKDNQEDCVQKRRNGELRVTHCPQGHPYDDRNTVFRIAKSGRPARECRECTRERQRRRYRENIEVMRARQRARRQAARVCA